MKKRLVCLALAVLTMGLFTACSAEEAAVEELGSITTANTITLTGSGIEVSGMGMSVNGNVVTINALGSYTVSGKLGDGQIVVDIKDESAEPELILDNVNLTNLSGPAVHIKNGKDLKLKFKGENTLVSGTPVMEADDSNTGAVLYAEDDMSIKGEDTAVLNVYGYINNGIACKNDLDVKAGNINIVAVNNGLRGSDSVEIKGGKLSVDAGNDGIKSTSADKEGKGYISIEAGEIFVSSVGDAVSAETELNISGGVLEIKTTGDINNVKSRGIAANKDISISGGSINVNSQDHALQSNGNISISGGELNLSSALEKAVNVDGSLNITGGELNLFGQEDAIDSIGDVNISGGNVYIRSVHDGVQAGEANSGLGNINISGGTVLVDSYKLAFNPRGVLNITGGTVLSVSTEVKAVSGQGFVQKEWNGVKGDELTVSKDGSFKSRLSSGYGFKSVLVGVAEGKVVLSDGKINVEMN